MIGIIGSGLAGLTAARVLGVAGLPVSVFDKGRGAGGRLATRRIDGAHFDHGAGILSASGDAFRAALDTACAAGTAASWPPGGSTVVGTPAMKSPFVDLPESVTLHQATRIAAIGQADGDGFILTDTEGSAHGPFQQVICAIPPAQAAELAPPHLAERLRGLVMAPQWTAMLAWSGAIPVTGPLIAPESGPIEKIQVMATKPGRPGTLNAFVVHATPRWTRDHLDLDKPEAARLLLGAFEAQAHSPLPPPDYIAGHRWLYARCETPLGVPFLDAGGGLRFGGDWALGAEAEHAYESGLAMAEAVRAALPAGAVPG